MVTIHIFGKSSGCQKCHSLRQRVERILQEEPYRGHFCVEFHDLLTEDGLVPFCMACIPPERICEMADVMLASNGNGDTRTMFNAGGEKE